MMTADHPSFEKQHIIFDTDMDTDCDDAGAFAMLLEAHSAGKAELMGVIADSMCRYAAPCCDAMAQYYEVTVPVGTVYSDDYMDSEADIARFSAYRKHSAKCQSTGKAYNRLLADKSGKVDRDFPAASETYRKLLAKAKDSSVTILCVGMLTAVAEALASKPDNISPLSGVQLFRQKVKRVITMGNPDSADDFNWGMDAYGTERFFSLCPVPIYISAEGAKIITGSHLSGMLENDHPLRKAYEIWLGGENRGRSSWDLVAALYAIEPQTPYLLCRERGNCVYNANEKKLYTHVSDSPQCKTLHVRCSHEKMTQVLSGYMLGNMRI